MNKHTLARISGMFAGLLWLVALPLSVLYTWVTSPMLYQSVLRDAAFWSDLNTVLATELLHQTSPAAWPGWLPAASATLAEWFTLLLQPAELEPFLAMDAPEGVRYALRQRAAPPELSAQAREYLTDLRQAHLVSFLWQQLPPCDAQATRYCQPTALGDKSLQYAELQAWWDDGVAGVWQILDQWQGDVRPVCTLPGWAIPTGLGVSLGMMLLSVLLASGRQRWRGIGTPLFAGGLGALLLSGGILWFLYYNTPSVLATTPLLAATHDWLVSLIKHTALVLSRPVLCSGTLSAALGALFLAFSAERRIVQVIWIVISLAALAGSGWFLVQFLPVPEPFQPSGGLGATPTPFPTATPTPTPTPTPYWPVSPGTPVPTAVGPITTAHAPEFLECTLADGSPILTMAVFADRLYAVKPQRTVSMNPYTLTTDQTWANPITATMAIFSPRGDTLVLTAHYKTYLYAFPDWEPLVRHSINSLSYVAALAISEEYLLLGLEEGKILIVDMDTRLPNWDLMKLYGHAGAIQALAIHPTALLFASGAYDKEIWLWNLTEQAHAGYWRGHIASITALIFSPDGEYIASSDQAGKVIVWEAASGSVLQTWTLPDNTSVNRLLWVDDLLLGGTARGAMAIFSPTTGHYWTSEALGSSVQALTFNASQLAMGLADGRVCLWGTTSYSR